MTERAIPQRSGGKIGVLYQMPNNWEGFAKHI
jgi:hypothetical protein